MRVAFVLPGLHRVCRGAEVAFESVATELARMEGMRVVLFGSGEAREGMPYEFVRCPNVDRGYFRGLRPMPVFRSEYVWEEFTFLPGFLLRYRPWEFDLTVGCSYPFLNWAVRVWRRYRRPAHVFVTQNGDHAPATREREYRFFGCDGLVCTNPDYFDRNRERWFSCLIPNGVDPEVFRPGEAEREALGMPVGVPLGLVVSALIESKRVEAAIEAVARVERLHLVVCGDGPLRERVEALGRQRLGKRFQRRTFPRAQMPAVYRSADVFLHMSLDEPSANAYIEALATGLPIVTHDRRVTRWTLEEEAVLVDATDLDAVAEGLRRALELRGGEWQRRRVVLAKRRFSWREIAGQYREFFEEVLRKTVRL